MELHWGSPFQREYPTCPHGSSMPHCPPEGRVTHSSSCPLREGELRSDQSNRLDRHTGQPVQTIWLGRALRTDSDKLIGFSVPPQHPKNLAPLPRQWVRPLVEVQVGHVRQANFSLYYTYMLKKYKFNILNNVISFNVKFGWSILCICIEKLTLNKCKRRKKYLV